MGGHFRGEKRSNDRHRSRINPGTRLYKKLARQEAKLSYLGRVLVENRNGLIAAAMTMQADGRAERDAALLSLNGIRKSGRWRVLVGADKGHNNRDLVLTVSELEVTPLLAQNTTNWHSAVDERTTRHNEYHISMSERWLVQKSFGWLTQIGLLKKAKPRVSAKVDWLSVFSCAVFNLRPIPKVRQ